jgi:RNA polymerase sigma-70 factor (family 1)
MAMALQSFVDSKLVELWRTGNERAYQELFDRYFCKLYHYTRRFIPDTRVSEEIVMDVMLNVWQKKHLLNTGLPVSAYLFKSVKNKLIDYLRKRKVKTISLEHTTLEPFSSFIPDNRLMQQELEGMYKTGLESLPPQKKRIFTMSREYGNSYQEIADKLSLSKNTVENHMVAAIRLLKDHMRVASAS